MNDKKVVVSSSLIRTEPRIPLSKEDGKRFCLGLPGWCPCEDCQSGACSTDEDDLVQDSVTSSVCQSDFNTKIDPISH